MCFHGEIRFIIQINVSYVIVAIYYGENEKTLISSTLNNTLIQYKRLTEIAYKIEIRLNQLLFITLLPSLIARR